jgi:hypothetical protein
LASSNEVLNERRKIKSFPGKKEKILETRFLNKLIGKG